MALAAASTQQYNALAHPLLLYLVLLPSLSHVRLSVWSTEIITLASMLFGPQKCDQYWSQKHDRALCGRHWRLQIWDPNSRTKKSSVAGHKLPLLGPRLARRDSNLKFLRLTLPFVFWKLLARALSHTHGGSTMARPQIAPFLAPQTMVNTVVMLHHGCRCHRPTPRTNAQARKCTKLRQVSSNRAKDVSRT